MSAQEKDYFGEFRDSHWVAKGSDPKAQKKVIDEFDDKLEKVKRVVSDRKFLKNLRTLFNYLVSGEDLAPKALIIGALLYFISPIDLVPDFIPVAGYLDDIAVVGGVVAALADSLKRFEERRSRGKDEEGNGERE